MRKLVKIFIIFLIVIDVGIGGYFGYKALTNNNQVSTAEINNALYNPAKQEQVKVQTFISAGQVWQELLTGIEFVWVPPGEFILESDNSDFKEKPAHQGFSLIFRAR